MDKFAAIILVAGLFQVVFGPVCGGQESGSEARGPRVLQFPEEYSVGLVRLLARDKGSGGPERRVQAVGKVEVPPDKVVVFHPYKIAWRRGWALSTLKPDDIYILSFDGWYEDARASVMKDIARLTGLEGLYLKPCRDLETGLRHLVGLKKLRRLTIPVGMKSQEMAYVAELPSLELLSIGGPMVTDDSMVHIGKLTSLVRLGVRANVGEGLAHLKELKSLRYLNLRRNQSENLDNGLRHIAGLTELEELNLRGTTVSDAGLAHLSGLKKLRKLNLMMTRGITGAGMAHLKNLKSLEEIVFPCGGVGDVGLVHLAELDSLRSVRASEETTDKGLAAITRMKSLKSLDIVIGKKVTDAGFAELCKCPHLESLGLYGGSLTDERLAKLAEIKTLRHLGISGTPITGTSFGKFKCLETLFLDSTLNVTGDGLATLSELSSLTELSLHDFNLGKTGTSHLAGLTSLRKLNILYLPEKVTFGDDDLAHLADLTSLEYVSITIGKSHQSTITDQGLAHLSNLKALEYLRLGICPGVTDVGLKHLEGLSRLEDLTLAKSRITMAGVARLKEKIPEVGVTAPCTMAEYWRRVKAIKAGRPFG